MVFIVYFDFSRIYRFLAGLLQVGLARPIICRRSWTGTQRGKHKMATPLTWFDLFGLEEETWPAATQGSPGQPPPQGMTCQWLSQTTAMSVLAPAPATATLQCTTSRGAQTVPTRSHKTATGGGRCHCSGGLRGRRPLSHPSHTVIK